MGHWYSTLFSCENVGLTMDWVLQSECGYTKPLQLEEAKAGRIGPHLREETGN